MEPIQAGLYSNSSYTERRQSLKKLVVLKDDLAPKVNRADMSVLKNVLPPKKEFVITVPLTDLQREAYLRYVRSMVSAAGHSRTKSGKITQTTLWHWLGVLTLLCNHPACFKAKLSERKEDAKKEVASTSGNALSTGATDIEEVIAECINAPLWKVGVSEELVRDEQKLFDEVLDLFAIEHSFKVKLLCQILDTSKAVGDKVLVFSQVSFFLNMEAVG